MPDLIGNTINALLFDHFDERADEQDRQDRLEDFAPAKRSGARPGFERLRDTSGGRNGGDAPGIGQSCLRLPGSAPSAHGREPRSSVSPSSGRMNAASERADSMEGRRLAPRSSSPSVSSHSLGRPTGGEEPQ